MQGEIKERWLELCELAAREQNPEKLLHYVQEINRLLDEKQKRINQPPKLKLSSTHSQDTSSF
jgi:hypothetical protein